MRTEMEIEIRETRMVLRQDGSLLLPDCQTLLVADLHLGKESSFRAGGIPVPDGPTEGTLDLLAKAIAESSCRRLVILGDMIHDRHSMSDALIKKFATWRTSHPALCITLVLGNHDRQLGPPPAGWDIEITPTLDIGNFSLQHEAPNTTNTEQFYIEGHWHPVVTVGRGADATRARCFAQKSDRLTLPAFGMFKGGQGVKRSEARFLFPILEGSCLPPLHGTG